VFRDYEEFFAALNDHRVRYLIVGAHAVAFHARSRATKDIDILFELGLNDLIRAKEAAGRDQDRADLRALKRAKSRTSRGGRAR